jgi:hypothetical protein
VVAVIALLLTFIVMCDYCCCIVMLLTNVYVLCTVCLYAVCDVLLCCVVAM